MAFTVPTFNLLCDIYTGPWLTKALRSSNVPCNLAMGRRVQQAGNDYIALQYGPAAPNLLLPAFTDIRDGSCAGEQDIVECPSGSGRWYFVSAVDDVAKGFSNEYRLAAIGKVSDFADHSRFPGVFWPTPIP